MKRILSFIFALLTLFGVALAESPADRLAQLDIISQLDERLRDKAYDYMNTKFYEQGCLPSSVYNALIALVGTPDADATLLIPELLNSITDPRSPRETMVIVDRLPYALSSAKPETATAALMQHVNEIQSWSALRHADQTLQEISRLGGGGILLVDKLNVSETWEALIQLAMQLNEAGYGDAALAFSSVGGGYSYLPQAPFGAGLNGHYIALYLQVDEFCRTGTFYLLDSVPRALPDEAYGDGTPFTSRYTFVQHNNTSFTYNFTPHRISDSIVQFSLTAEQLAQLEDLLSDTSLTSEARDAKLLALHQRHMESVVIYGMNQAMLYIP